MATENWRQICNADGFVKWRYKDTPYRVIADLDESRGHYRALFTSVYGTDSYVISGNLGGGSTGMMKAITEAEKFMTTNANGCPPPGEYGS